MVQLLSGVELRQSGFVGVLWLVESGFIWILGMNYLVGGLDEFYSGSQFGYCLGVGLNSRVDTIQFKN